MKRIGILKVFYFHGRNVLSTNALCEAEVAETKDLDENTLLDLDKNGQICAITIVGKLGYFGAFARVLEQITP